MTGFDLAAWWAPFLAFGAGVVAFASPCVLPLVPGYLSFVSASGGAGDPGRRRLVPMLLFVGGFSLVFTLLGVFAGVLIPLVRSVTGQRIAGLVVLAAGVFLLMYALRIGSAAVYAEHRPWISRVRPGVATAFPLGMAFAAGWTPCIGPVLAGTLALATAQADPLRSGLLLLSFSLGLGVPFLLVGLGVGGLLRRLAVLQRHYRAIAFVSGGTLVGIGVLLITGLWVRLLAPVLRLVTTFEPPI